MKVVYCREEFGYNFEEFACLLFPNDETNADEVSEQQPSESESNKESNE